MTLLEELAIQLVDEIRLQDETGAERAAVAALQAAELRGKQAAAEECGRLRAALDNLLEPLASECRYDHHGNCQEHFIGNPCVVAEARATLEGYPCS